MTVRTVTPADGAASLTFPWGDGTEILHSRQLIDVTPGSDLEAAIGLGNLTALTGSMLSLSVRGRTPGAVRAGGPARSPPPPRWAVPDAGRSGLG